MSISVPSAELVHGTQPQFLIEKIIRLKIYDSTFWKEQCFALTAETLVDRAVKLTSVGGCFGGMKTPSDFLCLLMKMLQIAPERDIVLALLTEDDFKYVRILACVYVRLVFSPVDVYNYLEPLLNDYRKIRCCTPDGDFVLSYVDAITDELLVNSHIWSISLPRLPTRWHLEQAGKLDGARISTLADIDELNLSEQHQDNHQHQLTKSLLESQHLIDTSKLNSIPVDINDVRAIEAPAVQFPASADIGVDVAEDQVSKSAADSDESRHIRNRINSPSRNSSLPKRQQRQQQQQQQQQWRWRRRRSRSDSPSLSPHTSRRRQSYRSRSRERYRRRRRRRSRSVERSWRHRRRH